MTLGNSSIRPTNLDKTGCSLSITFGSVSSVTGKKVIFERNRGALTIAYKLLSVLPLLENRLKPLPNSDSDIMPKLTIPASIVHIDPRDEPRLRGAPLREELENQPTMF